MGIKRGQQSWQSQVLRIEIWSPALARGDVGFGGVGDSGRIFKTLGSCFRRFGLCCDSGDKRTAAAKAAGKPCMGCLDELMQFGGAPSRYEHVDHSEFTSRGEQRQGLYRAELFNDIQEYSGPAIQQLLGLVASRNPEYHGRPVRRSYRNITIRFAKPPLDLC